MPTSLKSIYSAGGRIKSIQRGTTAVTVSSGLTTVNVTISAVNTAKTMVFAESTFSSVSNGVMGSGYANLTTSTNLAVVAGANTASQSVSVHWQVVEYE